MTDFKKLTAKEKALKINLNPQIYGSFAEIGAGQEVASSFFRAGGASGTIAKTISAYDMTFSDSIYGKCERYVCEARLNTMLDKEYGLVEARLQERASYTRFFAFANTVETLNYSKTNQGQGWVGVRFQLSPQSPPNDCIIHVLMNDADHLSQYHALGVLGVNMIYACFFDYSNPEYLLNSLVDELSPGSIEIDMISLSGPDFKGVDNRLLSLKLVKNGLSKAAMFGPDGRVLQPSTCLYKKNVLAVRSRFRPVTHVTMDMINVGKDQFCMEADVDKNEYILLAELSLSNLRAKGKINDKDFLDRVDVLCSMGITVLISKFEEYYKLVNYLSPLTNGRKIGIILGIHNLKNIFEERYYNNLGGGLLEALGMLFAKNVKLYVYPEFDTKSGKLLTCEDFGLPKNQAMLSEYLFQNHKMEDLKKADKSILHIVSDEVLELIESGNPEWENMVPGKVSAAIKEKNLFNYHRPEPGLEPVSVDRPRE